MFVTCEIVQRVDFQKTEALAPPGGVVMHVVAICNVLVWKHGNRVRVTE